MPGRILVVDDEIGMQIALREVLQRQGHTVVIAGDGREALQALETDHFDIVLTDVRMPEVGGMELLERIRSRWPKVPVVIMTAYGTIEDAVDAMKNGAADYLLKPFSTESIEEMVNQHLRSSNLPNLDTTDSEPETAPHDHNANPIAVSQPILQILSVARDVADSKATILIQGESGTGKEVIARYIHSHSDRRERPFVAVNCAALPEGLLESELFGHEKGAFTGAVLARKGKFELANHGTLLLDEISEMPLALQAKLLRVLQEREIDPIGAQRPVSLDVRVIATTNRDLHAYVREGKFREDLFYRLQVILLEIPPLRERREDIIPLADFFVRRHCRLNHRPRRKISASMRQYLQENSWRGNVRELENFLERAVLLCKKEEIDPESVFIMGRRFPVVEPSEPVSASPQSIHSLHQEEARNPLPSHAAPQDSLTPWPPAGSVTLEEMERRLILQTLDQVGGNRTRAADLLGVSVRTIRNKLTQYGLKGPKPVENQPASAGF